MLRDIPLSYDHPKDRKDDHEIPGIFLIRDNVRNSDDRLIA